MSAALGWLGLRVVRGGHARLVAVLTVVLGAAFIVVPLLAVVGLPFMALPVGVGIAAWHLVQAAWFRVRAEGRTARVASLGHLVAALMVAATVLVAALARHRATATEAGALAAAVFVAALAAIVAHLATARYMAAARPWVDLVDSFG